MNCQLRAVLPGFVAETIDLARRSPNQSGRVDVGTIVLHRMKEVQGFTISVTSALAPRKAAEECEKGCGAEKKSKWSEAKSRFARAVEIYPDYAAAWLELGRIQMRLNDVASAKLSFERSASADSKFISPHQSG